MTKESIIEQQKLDCNCNDCIFLQRNLYKQQLQNQFHEGLQRIEFDRDRNTQLFIAFTLRDKTLQQKTLKQRFMPKKPNMSYGYCRKFDFKEISFIPNTLQLENQSCFKHRKEI